MEIAETAPPTWTAPDLRGTVAVVTGASRGAGKGIALVLGEAGATVYVTGRSTREAGVAGGPGRTGTVQDTAEQVTARGGRGIPVRCDHTVDDEVATLFRRVDDEQERLDLLVNNAWGGYEQYDHAQFVAPFWEQPLAQRWHGMYEAGVRVHFAASQRAAPLLLRQRRGLIVNTIAWSFGTYLGNLFYDVAKAAISRMASGLAHELRPHGVAAVALAPGWMRTEAVLQAFETDEAHWQTVPELAATETTEYLGRAVAALAADPQVMRWSGQQLTVGDLAREYGFTDIDGRQPPPFRIGSD